ncbi:MAG: Mur ligase family protein [Candidatus Saccharimonadales bacterium]
MLQNTEYKLHDYFAWWYRTNDFRTVMKRRSLERTRKIKLLQMTLWGAWILLTSCAIFLIAMGFITHAYVIIFLGVLVLVMTPRMLAYGITLPLLVGRVLIQLPKERAMIREAKKILANHSATKIAIVGSYGKTTVKEILGTVLAEHKKIAVTPGNMNTAIGISRFAKKLTGDEEILIIEFGEEKPGDVWHLAQLTHPTMAVMTGINEAHLSSFKSLKHTTETIFEIVTFLGRKAKIYKNGESNILLAELKKDDPLLYDRRGVDGWKVRDINISLEQGTSFTAKKGDKIVRVRTGLIGRHNIGPSVLAVSIADSLGVSVKNIESGLKKVTPFEHRMDPKKIHGAWIIDDTYNGNSDGVAAGLALLKTLPAKRRIYVTPGLVEVGSKNEEVHTLIGKQIASSADMVVLMNNSVTDFIVSGLKAKKFKGEILVIDNPLDFYTNIDQFVAAGDVVLMQNDWTDNYQ